MRARYDGKVSDTQVNWGSNDDPRPLLIEGKIYDVLRIEEHTWHTKIILEEFPDKKFNDVNFTMIGR